MYYLVIADASISVEELYSNMVVDKVKATAHASSSRMEQGSCELPLVLDVEAPNLLHMLQQSLLLPLFLEVIGVIIACITIHHSC